MASQNTRFFVVVVVLFFQFKFGLNPILKIILILFLIIYSLDENCLAKHITVKIENYGLWIYTQAIAEKKLK